MKKVVNIHEAKTQLSRIVEEVAAGAEFVIAKAGRPMARLSPINALPKAKRLGQLKGKIRVPDDFNTLVAQDILGQFEGR